VLEQLKKVEGVDAAMANHTGSMIQISLKRNADVDTIANEMTAILEKEGRKPKRLSGGELVAAVDSETWRTAENVNELSEIEFRTVFERRVKQFVDQNDLDEETTSKLMDFANQILDATPKSTTETDWGEFCGGLAAKMVEKAKAILSDEQLEELRKKLKARVVG
jgi:hypothetical protein